MNPKPPGSYVLDKQKRLPVRRKAVTVCINAIANEGEAIVSCVDTRVTTATTSLDPLLGQKMTGMRGWTILSSGTFSYVESLVDAFYGEITGAENNDPPMVERCLDSALRAEMPKFSAARYLTPYGLDMPRFFSSRSQFTDERWNELSRLMLEYSDSYDVEILVSGWGATQEETDRRGGACIFSASKDGVLRYSDVGFHACGSGGSTAHSILSFFNQEPRMTLAETIYHVAAAKFMSERTAGVGEETVMRVGLRTGNTDQRWKGYFIQPDEMDELRSLWQTHTPQVVPPEAEDRIVAMLATRGSVRVTPNHMVRGVQGAIEQTRQSGAQTSEPEQ
jgi:hypothetical protein